MPNVDIIDGMSFGSGVDLGGRIFGDGVVRTAPETVGGGQTSEIVLTLVESQEEQDRALDLSTEVSAAFGLFGGSAKFNLSQKMHFHQFSVTLVIRATVMNAFQQMRDVQLTASAKELIKNGDMPRFREQFGDFFIRGMRTGGQYCAVLQIIGHDQSDQSEVRASLEAGGILGSVAASTQDSFASLVKKATSRRKTKFAQFQIGGKPVGSIDPPRLVAHALNFATEIKEAKSSEAFTALALPYETLDRPKGPNFVDIINARETLDLLMRKRRDAMTRLTAFDFVVANPEQFIMPPGKNVNAIVGRFENAVAALTSAASTCVNTPAKSADALRSISHLDIPVDELPQRRAGVSVLKGVAGTWVSDNTNFNFKTLVITPTSDKTATVVATSRIGPHGPEQHSVAATLDGGTKVLSLPGIIIGHPLGKGPPRHFLRINLGDLGPGTQMVVQETTTMHLKPNKESTAVFRRQ